MHPFLKCLDKKHAPAKELNNEAVRGQTVVILLYILQPLHLNQKYEIFMIFVEIILRNNELAKLATSACDNAHSVSLHRRRVDYKQG